MDWNQRGHQNYRDNMRKIWGVILFLIPCCLDAATPMTVDYVIDGDTFAGRVHIDTDIEITVRVRIRNVDTPEIHGECASEIEMANRARERLVELIPIDSVVMLDDIGDDKYLGRIDAVVLDAKNRDVGKILIDEGLGRSYNGGRRNPWCK